jgi:hypothetical protein
MIDTTTETLLSLSQAARALPSSRGGRPVTLSCVLRWVLDGVRLPSGEVVRLEALRIGGRWLTSQEAIQRFAERLTPRLDGEPAPTPRTPAARRRASERAARELEAAGI